MTTEFKTVTVKLESAIDFVPVTIDLANLTVEESDKCACGAESAYGCHGVRDGQVFSEYFCKECKNGKDT